LSLRSQLPPSHGVVRARFVFFAFEFSCLPPFFSDRLSFDPSEGTAWTAGPLAALRVLPRRPLPLRPSCSELLVRPVQAEAREPEKRVEAEVATAWSMGLLSSGPCTLTDRARGELWELLREALRLEEREGRRPA